MPQQTETETEAPRKRGRPRPAATIQRDADILRRLEEDGPLTRNELCELTELSRSIVHLSLDRLRKDGKVRLYLGSKSRKLWTAQDDDPCP